MNILSLTHLAIARIAQLASTARCLCRDASGVAALEFAIVAPLLLIFYLGTFETAQILDANSKVSSTADTIGNLVTRMKTMDETSLKNIFAISSAIMNPFDINALTMTITAVRVDANGKGTVHWSKASKGVPLREGATYPIPAELKAFTDSYFVVSSASYDYKTPFGYNDMIGDMILTHSNNFRPRKSTEVTWK